MQLPAPPTREPLGQLGAVRRGVGVLHARISFLLVQGGFAGGLLGEPNQVD